MPSFDTPLPIDAALPELMEALERGSAAVLVAPPGAGKTTRVPLALLDRPWVAGRRLILLEPRRIAARAAAARMAATLGEQVGETVGLRVRLGSRIGPKTRIEVVTEGIFARMLIDDPALEGVAAVLFDEFHERSLDADFCLALALDAQAGLREDLRILVMSATLDGARVAALLGDAAVVTSEGRAFPVETRHLPRDPARRLDEVVTEAILRALRAEPGSLLVFLPGQGEILRVARLLEERLPALGAAAGAIEIAPLYGAMEPAQQDRAIRPAAPGRRKVVLATSIAETSITIEGVRVVIDSGLTRVPVYEPDIGVTRLETVRVSRAAADQRRGRAGRTGPGVCYRLWGEAQTGALEAFARPEILSSDLAPLLLDCAAWGVSDPQALRFLDSPPRPALAEAAALLAALGARDADGRLTAAGRALRALPLPPRLARMLLGAGAEGEAAELAAVLVERGLGGGEIDLAARLDRFRRERGERAAAMRALASGWAGNARRLAREAGLPAVPALPSPAGWLALAYPDRIARRRRGQGTGVQPVWLLANGRAAKLEPHEPLAREEWLVVAEMSGAAAGARILAAAALEAGQVEAVARAVAPESLTDAEDVAWDAEAGALRRRAGRRIGAIRLSERALPLKGDAEEARVLCAALMRLGPMRLPWSKAQRQLLGRARFLAAAGGPEWPDLSDEGLAAGAEAWLAPALIGAAGLADVTADRLQAALDALLPWPLRQALDRDAPARFEAPTGTQAAVDYEAEAGPTVSIRVQELFGLASHPTLAGGRVPLVLELLSPAHRPIQVTRDLPGFWRGSWAEVRAEMRGRYPRHPWPEDPAAAAPTTRAKPRGT